VYTYVGEAQGAGVFTKFGKYPPPPPGLAKEQVFTIFGKYLVSLSPSLPPLGCKTKTLGCKNKSLRCKI